MAEPRRPARIQLIGWNNQRGLSHDLRLLRETLESLGHEVHVTAVGAGRKRGWLRAWRMRVRLMRQARREGRADWRFDLGITLEHVHAAYLGLARRNAFVPNPEWLSPRDRRELHRFNALLAKTRSAEAALRQDGLPVRYIGFRSVDCLDRRVPREPRFLHLAGASRMKGTQRLLDIWARHPAWPPLLVLQSATTASDPLTGHANIEHRIGTVADLAEVRALQNRYAFHACLSEAEGWGHYLVEAMSCGAVVLTCDAPPMNELVDASRGLPVTAHATGTLNAATRYAFDEAALENAVAHAAAMQTPAREALGARARAWFEANEASFAGRLDDALQPLLPPCCRRGKTERT